MPFKSLTKQWTLKMPPVFCTRNVINIVVACGQLTLHTGFYMTQRKPVNNELNKSYNVYFMKKSDKRM